jgi:hypothetical protein
MVNKSVNHEKIMCLHGKYHQFYVKRANTNPFGGLFIWPVLKIKLIQMIYSD